ncbi:conjugative transposon protein TraN [Myroides albus]|uniref:Conjugative transposon protein TraN n=1 Tax=Myroides albus TaxID=2562892 RepID=A0A6I3LTN4_9FLAO|nr:conjugative transposon protein TraN [Myroides albus]MTG99335.1 conjugative transposon protein TraN [Myroides albus]UVD79093.1 conjugative transposon protein TraN [Myroides albus]
MRFIITFSLVLMQIMAVGQNSKLHNNLTSAEIKPFQIELTLNKTTHILFDSSIRYVDLGSNDIIASKVESAENVLRLKAISSEITQTNFTVITQSGLFYNFNVNYSDNPENLNYDLKKLQTEKERLNSNILFQEFGQTSPTLVDYFLESIVKRDKSFLNISDSSFGIKVQLKGIYTQEGKLYFHLSWQNKSNLDYHLDYVSFKLLDKKLSKKSTIEQIDLKPIKSYRDINVVKSHQSIENVFVLDAFDLSNYKILRIDINSDMLWQSLRVSHRDILKAKKINKLAVRYQ